MNLFKNEVKKNYYPSPLYSTKNKFLLMEMTKQAVKYFIF